MTKEIKNFYDEVYRGGDIRDNALLYRWIARLIDAGRGESLLDVGCGTGCSFKSLNTINVKMFGLDISIEALKKLKKSNPEINLCSGDGERLPFADGSFDKVISLGSIEHFPDPGKGLAQICRVLKPKGRALFILPNSFYLGDILKVIFTGGLEEAWQIQEKLLTKSQWKMLIEENGFVVNKVYGYNKFPELFQSGTLKFKSLGKFIKLTIMRLICPLNLSWQFVYICDKKQN